MYDIEKNVENLQYASIENMNFKLREIEHIKSTSNEWTLQLQFLESHIMLVVASGQGWLTIDGGFIELRQGGAYFCSPGQLTEALVHSFDERGMYYMRFDVIEDDGTSADYMRIVKQNSRFPAEGEVFSLSPVSISILCDNICQYLRSDNRLQRFRGQIFFQELLYILLQDALHVQESGSEESLEYVKYYIEKNYQQDLTIEQLAKAARISSRHFMRLFKKRYGCSAIEYLTIHRIKQAQHLIRTGKQYRLKDIARYVGYHDDLYFRRKFKQVSGIPPAAFMKNSKQKIVAYHSWSIGGLLALQIIPCAAPANHPWTEYYQRKYETNTVLPLSLNQSIKLEELRRAAPDFIVGIDSLISLEEQDRLREIAPVFFVPWMNNDWRMHLKLLSQFLGRTEVAEVWIERYERKAGFVSEQVKSVIKEDSLLILRISGERLDVLGNKSIATVFYDDLHIVPARGIDRILENQQVSCHQLVDFDADRLLLIVDEDTQSKSSWQTLIRSEQWRGLRAVLNGRVGFLPARPWIEYTAFTHDFILDEAVKLWRDRT